MSLKQRVANLEAELTTERLCARRVPVLEAQLAAANARAVRAESQVDELLRQLGEQTQKLGEQTQKLGEQTQKLGEQTQSIERLRKEFKDQREADRSMVERNLRGLLDMHYSSVKDLKLAPKKLAKTLQATSNRFHAIGILPETPENWRAFYERRNQANEEEERLREVTEIHFNHSVRKPTSKASRKRSYEQSVKTNDASITDVIIKTKDEVYTRLRSSVEVSPPRYGSYPVSDFLLAVLV